MPPDDSLGGMRRVLIAGGGTGGHLMPALAIAAALREVAPDVEPVLVGASRGVESRLLPARDFRFHLLPAEPIYRRTWWKNFRWPLILGRLFRRLAQLFEDEQPVAVLGTGGYASAPVVWWAARHGIPTAIQEQNAYPGLSNRWLAGRVRHIYLGLPEARALLSPGPSTEVFITGNPIAVPAPERRESARAQFGIGRDRRMLLVTGGSQGALAINRTVAGWLDGGLDPSIAMLWVTGPATYAEFARYHQPPSVQVISFLDPMADGYAAADLVVSRAGMITVAELCAWGLASILIPLPTAAADHQTHNGRAMAAAGAATLLPQSELSVDRLRTVAGTLLHDDSKRQFLAAKALSRGKPHAAREIASTFLTLG